MNMRKIVVEPQVPDMSMKRSPLRAGLVLDDKITNYRHTFSTGRQILYMSSVEGEVEIGRSLSQAIYSIVSSKFGNIVLASSANGFNDCDIYLEPSIKSFTYSPPFTGYSSHIAEIVLETRVYGKGGTLLGYFIIEQRGSRSAMKQVLMETNYEQAQFAINEAVNNLLADFSKKIDGLY